MQRGWSIRQTIRLLVTSATYRQSSNARPELAAKDPDNTLLARQSRLRLPAELIRDEALYAAGLLDLRIGGRSVKPPQPKGVAELSYAGSVKWDESTGPDRYRRGLYIHFQRTVPYPQLMSFDAPAASLACTRRERTDTPLQALVTLNDPAYVEAARHLSERLLEHGPEAGDRLEFGFRLVTARHPSASEKTVLQDALQKYLAKYQKNPDAAKQLISVGESPVNEKLQPPEFAAYTMVASLLLNLDETLNKN